jgi:16S rRNA processing protein RimM
VSRHRAGFVGRAHGLDGSFYVAAPVEELLDGAEVLQLDGEDVERAITRQAGTAAKPILRLEGVSDRNGADAIRGKELTVGDEQLPPLEDDEYLATDLEGCAVVSAGGRAIGTVEGLTAYPSCEVLDVAGPDGPLLIPMVRDAIVSIDTAAQRIVVDAQFLGLNAPDSA